MNKNEVIKELKDIIDGLERIVNEADNENPNIRFIQEIDAAIECLKIAIEEL